MASNVFKFNSVIRLAKFASDPSDQEAGYMYYNTTDNVVKAHNGTSWDTVAADEVSDSVFKIYDSDAATRKMHFDLQNVTEGEDRIVTMADANVDLADVNTNKAHLTDTTDAHAGSAITNTPSGNLAATTVQGALDELQSDVDNRALDSAVIKKDGSVAFTGANPVSINAKLTNVTAGTLNSDGVNKGQMDSAISTALAGLDFQPDVLDVQEDGTLDPGESPTLGDRYIITSSSALHANFGSISGIGNNDIVEYSGSAFVVVYDVSVKGEGVLTWDQASNQWHRYDGSSWAIFGGLAGVTAGDGITKSGDTISIDLHGTNPALEIYESKLQAKVDGTTVTRTASGLAVGTIGDSNISSGIDAVKLADGSVSNTELQYINSLSSNAQDQIDTKIASVSADSSPSLGGNLTLGNSNVLIEGTSGMLRGDATNYIEEDYKHANTLTASQTGVALAALGFAHATYEGIEVMYKIKEATTNRVRIGRFTVVTNGTDVSISDTFNESADCGVVWDAAVNGANIDIKYTTTANNKTMHCDVKRIKA